MKKKLGLIIISLFSLSLNAQWSQLGLDIDGEAATDYAGWSVSSSADGLKVAINGIGNDANGSFSGHVRVYEFSAGSWTQLGGDIDGEAAGDQSGSSVCMSADGLTVAIGATGNDGSGIDAGHVRVYKFISGVWTQQGMDIDGELADDKSGYSVSLSDDGLILGIGASGNDGNGSAAGHVRVYKFISGAWIQQGADIDGEATFDNSGYSISMSADGLTIGIGAPWNDGNGSGAGHIRVYKFISGSWVQQGADIDGEAAGDQFGNSVSMSADGLTFAGGATRNDGNGSEAGHVRVYQFILGAWVQLGADMDGEVSGNRSGVSVSLSADSLTVAIGATENDGNGNSSGHVRIYKFISGAWTQQGVDFDGEAADDRSGVSVSLNAQGSKVVIGAYNNDGNGSNAGHARIYAICEPNGSIDTQIACDSLIWINGITYTVNNTTATDTLVNVTGCDSVITLNLSINNASTSTDSHIACSTYTWIDGVTYTTNNTTATDTLVNAVGCDSIITLNLTINNVSTSTDTQIACSTYTWINGITYTVNNTTATDTLVNAVGCDSIVTLNLTINNISTSTDTHIECGAYTWTNGITYTVSNTTATDTLVNAAGCDSIISLDLTIHTIDTTIHVSNLVLTANHTTGLFQWFDCETNEIIIGANDRVYNAISNGTYAVIITDNSCTDTSNCQLIDNVGVDNYEFIYQVNIYPNPTSGVLNLLIPNYKEEVVLTIFDMQGKEIYAAYVKGSLKDINLSGGIGMYIVQLDFENERKYYKVMVEN